MPDGNSGTRRGRPLAASAGVSQTGAMLIVHVFVHVLPEAVDAFAVASRENARASVQEPGIARFDVIQSIDDPARFVLVEVYRTPEAALAHKETAHYAIWRDTVADMMAEPRSALKYSAVHPAEDGWG